MDKRPDVKRNARHEVGDNLTETLSMHQEALKYAKRGWAVFPCHTANDGKCSCGKADCQHVGKHPRTPNGFSDGTTDEKTINTWWKKWPDANIGFALPPSIVVVDVDIKHEAGKYGDETLEELMEQHGDFTGTPTSLTGGGGFQFFYSTDKPVGCKTGLLPSIDVKTQGGYVILPPSMHASGRRYDWEASSDPDDTPLSPLPDFLYKIMTETHRPEAQDVPEQIPEGQRNDVLFKLSCSLRAKGLEELEILAALSQVNQNRCKPPVSDRELNMLVHSAAGYERGELQHTYAGTGDSLRPTDFTDSGNAAIFTREYKDKIIFVRAIGWLVWDGKKWDYNDLKATALAMEMAGKMLLEATIELAEARRWLTIAGSTEDKVKIAQAKEAEKPAFDFFKHAKNLRQQPFIKRMLELSKPELHVELNKLDADPFAINTPAGIIDLKTGTVSTHDPSKLCANITLTAPDACNEKMWLDFLESITCGDAQLQDFLQQVAGMAAVGKVFMESLIIAYGDGKNGKSTFFNALAAVLGSYAGHMAPEVLTTDKQNKGASLAELKGKRLVIMAELEEGKRLSTSVLKQLASTDQISAERKYKDPESFVPSHSAVLYTNHLPRVGSTDGGTWRRLTLIPFKAKITEEKDVKNFGEELVAKAGGAIMRWIVEGAVKFCRNGHALIVPDAVTEATEEYRDANDWLSAFIDERCEVGPGKKVKAGELLIAYRGWADTNGEYVRDKRDFVAELERRGFASHREKAATFWYGVGLNPVYYGTPIGGTAQGSPW